MDVETEKMCRRVKIGLFLFSQLNKCQTIQAFCQENVSHDKISARAKREKGQLLCWGRSGELCQHTDLGLGYNHVADLESARSRTPEKSPLADHHRVASSKREYRRHLG